MLCTPKMVCILKLPQHTLFSVLCRLCCAHIIFYSAGRQQIAKREMPQAWTVLDEFHLTSIIMLVLSPFSWGHITATDGPPGSILELRGWSAS